MMRICTINMFEIVAGQSAPSMIKTINLFSFMVEQEFNMFKLYIINVKTYVQYVLCSACMWGK